MNKIVSIVSLIIFCVVFAISGYKLYSIYAEYHEGDKQYEHIADKFSQQMDEDDSDKKKDEAEAGSDTANEKRDPLNITAPIKISFDDLIQENKDVVGWIYSEGTEINYPIVQGENNDTYLHRLFDGTYNKAGSIFMDFRCDATFAMDNTLIYGHHMKNKSMFGSLNNYGEQEYYDKHPILWILTPDRNYKVVLLAGYSTDGGDPIYDSAMEPESMAAYLDDVTQRSTFKAKKEYLENDEVKEATKIVTLSTCSYEQKNGRYLVVGYLIEE